MNQPVPKITDVDVKRIILLEFPENVSDALSILEEYGKEEWQKGGEARVRMAALKLANGNKEKLRQWIDVANRDYRDVISLAEYPACYKLGFQNISKEERQKIYEADWKQYQDWLQK